MTAYREINRSLHSAGLFAAFVAGEMPIQKMSGMKFPAESLCAGQVGW
jgi:hypothetical protein